jgi:hypothetical protein
VAGSGGQQADAAAHAPYADAGTNAIYNLLFCDDPALYRRSHVGAPDGPWKTLFAPKPDPRALAELAGDRRSESRVRLLACNALRAAGRAVETREVLGVVAEVGLDGGLDTLAAFGDGRARYINHTGKMVFWEAGGPPLQEIVDVLEASATAVAKIGPWDEPRLPPPGNGEIRLTFLVSDGLYLGQGPMQALQQDPLAGPVVSAATRLLVKLTRSGGAC